MKVTLKSVIKTWRIRGHRIAPCHFSIVHGIRLRKHARCGGRRCLRRGTAGIIALQRARHRSERPILVGFIDILPLPVGEGRLVVAYNYFGQILFMIGSKKYDFFLFSINLENSICNSHWSGNGNSSRFMVCLLPPLAGASVLVGKASSIVTSSSTPRGTSTSSMR